ncbi:MAG: LamG-like jellyroll fold domain-containing protein [Pirellulales bacterium]
MKVTLLKARVACVFVVLLSTFSAARAIDIETVLIGDSGNSGDPRVMNDGTSGYGGVAYEYRIGKYEVTNDEYAVFLNAIATTDTHEIYEASMGNTVQGGIVRSGGAPNYTYTVKPNMGNKPVISLTNYTARRFANWLHNGQPSGGQTAATTENGAYDLSGPGLPLRSASATWFLPSENEWYKAAYYDPRDGGSGGPPGNSHYWLYATGTLGQPTAAMADVVGNISNPGVNTANYIEAANWNGSAPFGNVTTVGSAGPLSASYYGTFDQSGNVSEFNENVAIRGGQHNSLQDAISAGVRFGNSFGGYAGLRIASVLDPPSPNGGLLAYWNAENGAVDVTGNGHDGTFQGNATTMAGGPFGNAFTFDGTGDYIDIGDELDLGTSDFTLSAWVMGDPTMNAWGRIFDKGFASGYALGRQANSNTIAFEFLASGSQGNTFDTVASLIDNTWHHVALVKSGTSVTIYADGAPENTETVSGASQNNTRSLLIGYNPGEGILGYWKGQLDELKIYGRALTPAEIAALALNPNLDLDGDYNNDGTISAADYSVWRDNLGAAVTLPNDTTPGFVTAIDYDVWRANFGATGATGSADVPVPEPTSLFLLALTAAAMLLRRQLRLHGRLIAGIAEAEAMDQLELRRNAKVFVDRLHVILHRVWAKVQQVGDLVFVVRFHQHDQHHALPRAELRNLAPALARQLGVVQPLHLAEHDMGNPRLALRKRRPALVPKESNRAERVGHVERVDRIQEVIDPALQAVQNDRWVGIPLSVAHQLLSCAREVFARSRKLEARFVFGWRARRLARFKPAGELVFGKPRMHQAHADRLAGRGINIGDRPQPTVGVYQLLQTPHKKLLLIGKTLFRNGHVRKQAHDLADVLFGQTVSGKGVRHRDSWPR